MAIYTFQNLEYTGEPVQVGDVVDVTLNGVEYPDVVLEEVAPGLIGKVYPNADAPVWAVVIYEQDDTYYINGQYDSTYGELTDNEVKIVKKVVTVTDDFKDAVNSSFFTGESKDYINVDDAVWERTDYGFYTSLGEVAPENIPEPNSAVTVVINGETHENMTVMEEQGVIYVSNDPTGSHALGCFMVFWEEGYGHAHYYTDQFSEGPSPVIRVIGNTRDVTDQFKEAVEMAGGGSGASEVVYEIIGADTLDGYKPRLIEGDYTKFPTILFNEEAGVYFTPLTYMAPNEVVVDGVRIILNYYDSEGHSQTLPAGTYDFMSIGFMWDGILLDTAIITSEGAYQGVCTYMSEI